MFIFASKKGCNLYSRATYNPGNTVITMRSFCIPNLSKCFAIIVCHRESRELSYLKNVKGIGMAKKSRNKNQILHRGLHTLVRTSVAIKCVCLGGGGGREFMQIFILGVINPLTPGTGYIRF